MKACVFDERAQRRPTLPLKQTLMAGNAARAKNYDDSMRVDRSECKMKSIDTVTVPRLVKYKQNGTVSPKSSLQLTFFLLSLNLVPK